MLPPSPVPRITALDALRGLAVLAMIIFHAGWDLDVLVGVSAIDTISTGWVVLRIVTASLFIFVAGVSSELIRVRYGHHAMRKAWRQAGTIALAAIVVSLATLVIASDRFIWFGILHFLAVAMLLGPLVWRCARSWLAALTVGCVAAGLLWQFTAYPLGVPGLTPGYFPTLDYYPLLPWLGVFFGGMLFGRGGVSTLQQLPAPLPLIFLGRHALAIYLIHQPVLIALGWAWFAIGR